MKRLIFLVLLLAALPAAAQDSLEAAKRHEIEAIQRQAQEKRAAAKRLLGQETAEISQLRRTDRRLNATRQRLRALESRRRVLGQDLQVTRISLMRSEKALELQKARLSRRLRNLYKYGGERPLEFMLSTQSFAQLLARWDFLVMIAEQDRMLVEDVLATKATVEQNQSKLENRLDEVARTAQKTNRETSALASLRTQKANTVKAIQSQRQEFEAAAAQLERTARQMRNLLAELERRRRAETDKARAEGRSPQPYTGDFARGEGRLEWPVRGEIIGHFGTEVHPKWGTQTMNNGIDISAPIGTPVHVVARGRVDYVSEDFGTYGQMVIVNHGDGYYTMYGHLSSIAVGNGVEVAPGQLIGYSGDTGSLKGPILHFEVRKASQSLDPEHWLK
jgi:murein hydrolase activator